jgi:hypothetical protein
MPVPEFSRNFLPEFQRGFLLKDGSPEVLDEAATEGLVVV